MRQCANAAAILFEPITSVTGSCRTGFGLDDTMTVFEEAISGHVMYHDNYVGGFACVDAECHAGVSPAMQHRHGPSATCGSEPVKNPNSTVTEAIEPLSMSQEMLMLCYISGQIEHSAWQEHIKSDPVLAAHFNLMWSWKK